MTDVLEVRCRCGHVRGEVSGLARGRCTHATCYCVDCRTFARFLAREDIMDDRGGTTVVQTAPANLRFVAGTDRIACVRLSPRGLFRWYADCCRTPLGNTISGSVPFVGLPRMSIDAAIVATGREPEELFGPRERIWGREALGGTPPGAPEKAPFAIIALALRLVVGWTLTGKRRPSPFFDPKTGQPIREPTVLSLDERKRLRDLDHPA
jgi:hypothetical protein